jgi:hypothetical protein
MRVPVTCCPQYVLRATWSDCASTTSQHVHGTSCCLLPLLRLTAPTCLATWALLASMNACHCASFAAAARTASRCSKSCGMQCAWAQHQQQENMQRMCGALAVTCSGLMRHGMYGLPSWRIRACTERTLHSGCALGRQAGRLYCAQCSAVLLHLCGASATSTPG